MEIILEQEFITALFLLVAVHFLCDTALQGDFLAKNKVRYNSDGDYNPIWWWALTAHSFIHALGAYLISHSLELAALMLISHWIIDLMKGEGYLTFKQDQFAHIVIVVCIALVMHGM